MSAEQAGFDERAKTWDDDPMKTARAQAVAEAIRASVPMRPGMSGLEFGCGTGLLSFAMQEEFARITLADTSPGMLEVLRQKVADAGLGHMTPLLLDEANRALDGRHFDVIYSLMTLHHVPDAEQVLKRFHGWLNAGSRVCVADLDAEDGSFHAFDPSIPYNGFNRSVLADWAEKAGFANVHFSTVFRITKGSPEREYPVFLMIAEKA